MRGAGRRRVRWIAALRVARDLHAKHLAEKILTSKAALEGERKQVTVLFADLKGSMELLADRDPEEARKLLDPVLERMMEAVHRYEGTVNQVMGDGIMALFGAPLAHEDHAVRACYAALRMQESVAQYAEGVFRSHGVPIQIRVGLNSGEVVVRAIGSDLRMDYTAVGQTTHLAARMEQMATPGTILLAPATLQLAEGYVQVAARGPVAVKGLPEPVEIYALTGASALRSRLHAAAARGFTRFVGRDAELEQLRRALALAHDGHGQLVAVVGEPGVGKSRLVYEFTHSHRTQEWLILEAGSVSYGKATSFIEESIRTLVETHALTRERGAYRLTRPIQAIEVPATVQVILAARIDRLLADDKQLLQTASVIGKDVPFVLLHAVAEAVEDAVHRGLTHLQAAEFLYETRLFPDPEYTFKHALTHEVTYGTLLQERRRALHARIVGAIERSYPDRLTEHVERLAHHAVRGEMWEQAVKYLHQAGTKALARSANREAVSCFEQALTALGHLPETRETLEQAIDLRFDLRTALFPLGEFERTLGYLREAESLARTLDDQRRLGQMSVYLCHNLWMTGHPTEALAFGQSAQAIAESLEDVPLQVTGNLYFGAACLRTGDHRRGEDLFLKVLRLLEGDRSRERFGLAGFPAVMARFFLDWGFADQGRFKEGIAHGQEGIRLAEALDHPYSLAAMCTPLAYLHIARGELSHAVRLLERGVALSREWDLTFISAQNTGILGYAYALSGRIAEGIPLLEHALSAIETMGFGAFQPPFLVYLGEAYILAGRLEDALAFAGRALTLARESGQRGYEAWALRLLGDVTARRDSPEQADGHYRDALAEELGMRPLVAHCHLGLGKLSRRTGKREQAREHLTTATTMYRAMDMGFWLEQAEAELTCKQ